MKDNQQINPVVAADGMSIEFELRGLPSLKFDLRKVSEINRNRAAAVGFADVRIVNAAAISRNAPDGSIRSATEMPKLKREKMEALIQHYESGTVEWRVKRAAGGEGRDNSGITLQAMKRVWPDKDCEARLLVHDHVDVALAVLLLDVGEAVELVRQRAQRLGQQADFGRLDAQFAGSGLHQRTDDADDAALRAPRFEPPKRCRVPSVIEAEPVDEAVVADQAEHARLRIARLRLGRDRADFGKPAPKTQDGIRNARVLVITSCNANRVWKIQAEHRLRKDRVIAAGPARINAAFERLQRRLVCCFRFQGKQSRAGKAVKRRQHYKVS